MARFHGLHLPAPATVMTDPTLAWDDVGNVYMVGLLGNRSAHLEHPRHGRLQIDRWRPYVGSRQHDPLERRRRQAVGCRGRQPVQPVSRACVRRLGRRLDHALRPHIGSWRDVDRRWIHCDRLDQSRGRFILSGDQRIRQWRYLHRLDRRKHHQDDRLHRRRRLVPSRDGSRNRRDHVECVAAPGRLSRSPRRHVPRPYTPDRVRVQSNRRGCVG